MSQTIIDIALNHKKMFKFTAAKPCKNSQAINKGAAFEFK